MGGSCGKYLARSLDSPSLRVVSCKYCYGGYESYVKLTTYVPASRGGSGFVGRRGVIRRFSDKSRRRLKQLLQHRISMDLFNRYRAFFITFTFQSEIFEDLLECVGKDVFLKILKALDMKYRRRGWMGIVKKEFTKRGVLHFHTITFVESEKIDISDLSRMWVNIVAHYLKKFNLYDKHASNLVNMLKNSVDVKAVYSFDQLFNYVTKYVQKNDYVREGDLSGWGRFWVFLNKKAIKPYLLHEDVHRFIETEEINVDFLEDVFKLDWVDENRVISDSSDSCDSYILVEKSFKYENFTAYVMTVRQTIQLSDFELEMTICKLITFKMRQVDKQRFEAFLNLVLSTLSKYLIEYNASLYWYIRQSIELQALEASGA